MTQWAVYSMLAIPGVVWVMSYLILVREFRSWNLFNVAIHESGKYTLLQTVFYYSHFLRELPLDTLFALAILWSYAAAGVQSPVMATPRTWPFWTLGVFLVIVVGGSIRSVGSKLSWQDLTQFRETDTRTGAGAHWQMHFLSTAVLMLLLMLPGVLLVRSPALDTQGLMLAGVFLGLSAIFRCGAASITRRRWILHGAREVFTYAILIALPAFLPLLAPGIIASMRLTPLGGLFVVCLAAVALFYLIVYRQSDLNAEASSNRGPAFLLSSHFFEHTLDFIYILLLIMAGGSI